jgi:hypothetical protein
MFCAPTGPRGPIAETYGWEDQEHGDESATHHRIFDMLMADALMGDKAQRLIASAPVMRT